MKKKKIGVFFCIISFFFEKVVFLNMNYLYLWIFFVLIGKKEGVEIYFCDILNFLFS